MKQSGTGSGWARYKRAAGVSATVLMVAAGTFTGLPYSAAVPPPVVDGPPPGDGPPGPEQPTKQNSYCTEVSVLPGTDFRVRPKFLEMLNLEEAWRFGRGGGVKVAVIDTGVTPHPRLPHLIAGGDYVMAGGDGLSDCDAHGTLVASLIAGAPANGAPLPPPRQTRRPPSVPTTEPTPTPPTPQTTIIISPTVVMPPQPTEPEAGAPGVPPPPPAQVPAPAQPPAPGQAPGAGYGGHGSITLPNYSAGGARVAGAGYPAAPPPAPDAFTGVAPDVELISIRQSSLAFGLKDPFVDEGDPQSRQKIDNIRTMARAIVHAADMGAQVINISQVVCMNVRSPLPDGDLGAAVRYAAVDRNVLIVAAAGDTMQRDCKPNPLHDPNRPNDPRNWGGVNTIVTPSWFDEFVLTVGAVDAGGAPLDKTSVAGPWVSIAAPGTDIEGLSPRDDGLMNAVDGPDNTLLHPQGTAFATALVSGVAALVRAKYPELSALQIRDRLIQTARPPAGGVDNQVGYGIVDPVAALTWDVPEGPVAPPEQHSAPLDLPPPVPDRNMTPVWVAAAGLAAALCAAAIALAAAKILRRSSRES